MHRIALSTFTISAMLWSTTAMADLVINIPDVPDFTLTDPIVSDEDVVINVLSDTNLVIAASITAPTITITRPAFLTIADGATLSGEVTIEAGQINLDDAGGQPPVIIVDGVPISGFPGSSDGVITVTGTSSDFDIEGGSITVSASTASGGDVSANGVSSQTPVTSGGVVRLGAGTDGALVETNISLNDANGVSLGNVNVVAAGRVTATGISLQDASGTPGITAISDAEAPVAIIQTDAGSVTLILDTEALGSLEADLGGSSTATAPLRANAFTGKLFSCPQVAPDARFSEAACAYAIGSVDRLDVGRNAGTFDETTYAFTLGAQTEIADDIFVGGALSYESSRSNTQTTDGETTQGRAGLVIKYDDQAFSAGLALAATYGVVKTNRDLVGGVAALGNTDARGFDARFRVGYGMTFGEFAVEPALAVSVIHHSQDGYAETGPALSVRQIASVDHTTLGIHPSVTFGADFVAGPYGTRLRPELALGLDWFSDPDATLTGTGSTGRSLFQTVSTDQLTGTVSAGLTVFAADDVALRLRYGGRFGENTSGHGGEVKVSLGF